MTETITKRQLDNLLDKPKPNKVYVLIGGKNTKCISNGNSWNDSEVKKIAK